MYSTLAAAPNVRAAQVLLAKSALKSGRGPNDLEKKIGLDRI
jgi:hypothetical protein